MKNLLMPRGWMSGWRGKRGGEGRREERANLWTLFFLLSFFLYGGTPAPETCTRGGRRIRALDEFLCVCVAISLRDDASVFAARIK